MEVYEYQVVSTFVSQELEARVCDDCEHLLKWGETKGVEIIKSELAFRLGTGEIEELCFDQLEDDLVSFLNRLGVIKLLDTIGNQCTEVELRVDWNTLRRNFNASKGETLTPQRHSELHQSAIPLRGGSFASLLPLVSCPPPSLGQLPPSGASTTAWTRSRLYQQLQEGWGSSAGTLCTRVGREKEDPPATSTAPPTFPRAYSGQGRGCFNCGEYNHHQVSCRFESQDKM